MTDECTCGTFDEAACGYCERWDAENCVCALVVDFPCNLHS